MSIGAIGRNIRLIGGFGEVYLHRHSEFDFVYLYDTLMNMVIHFYFADPVPA